MSKREDVVLDEGLLSLIQSANSQQDTLLSERRSDTIAYAVSHLKTVAYVGATTVIIVEVLLLADLSTDYSIPTWILFVVLWLGHAAIGGIAFNSVNNVCESLHSCESPSSSPSSCTQQWHLANEKTIPLIRYLILNLLKILWMSFMVLLFEILVYLSTLSLVPMYSCIIPVYIVAGSALFSAIICKSTSMSVAVSWFLVLSTATLLNVKIMDPSALSYFIVFIPVYLLILFWLVICFYILVCDGRELLTLKGNQFAMVILFSLSLLLFSVAAVSLQECLMGSNTYFFVSKVFVSSISLVGSVAFSFWLILYIRTNVFNIIRSMAAEKPLSLLKTSEGWAPRGGDHALVGVSFVIGDLDDSPPNPGETDFNQEKGGRRCGHFFMDVSLFCLTRPRWSRNHRNSVSSVVPDSSDSYADSYTRICDDSGASQPLLNNNN